MAQVFRVRCGNVRCRVEQRDGWVKDLEQPNVRSGWVVGIRVAARFARDHGHCPGAVPVIGANESFPVLALYGDSGGWSCASHAMVQKPFAFADTPVFSVANLVAGVPVEIRRGR